MYLYLKFNIDKDLSDIMISEMLHPQVIAPATSSHNCCNFKHVVIVTKYKKIFYGTIVTTLSYKLFSLTQIKEFSCKG